MAGKILSITGLAIIATLTAVENKIPDVSNLVKKNRLWCESIRHWKIKITSSDYNKFTRDILDEKIR